MEWWLISDGVVDEIVRALTAAQANLGASVVTTYRDALHNLESGLHETDEMPSDYREG